MRLTLTEENILHGKSAAGGLSALVRDLLDAHANEVPTAETVLRVLRAAAVVGLRLDAELGDDDAEAVVAELGGRTRAAAAAPGENAGIGAWYVTDHAIESACGILGFDDDDDEHWDYVARLLEGLAAVAKLKGPDRETDGEVWQVGQAHKRLRLLVSHADRPEGPLPQVIDVWRPHASWRRPNSPMFLPIPGEE